MIQVINTYKCNFECKHCLYSCTKNRRQMLDDYTLRYFLDNYSEFDNCVNYCGGETFLNPNWESQIKTLSCYFNEIRIVTNGSLFLTKKNYKPTKLYKRFVDLIYNIQSNIYVLVSNDIFHRNEYLKKGYNPEVYLKYMKYQLMDDMIDTEEDTRDVMIEKIIPMGRALKNNIYDHLGYCYVQDDNVLTLDPYGRIYGCENRRAYIGDIYTPKETVLKRKSELQNQKSCLKCEYKKIREKGAL